MGLVLCFKFLHVSASVRFLCMKHSWNLRCRLHIPLSVVEDNTRHSPGRFVKAHCESGSDEREVTFMNGLVCL